MIALTVLCGLFCSVFKPREDFDPPGTTGYIDDPFNFAGILEGSGEEFLKLDWYELFDDEFEYVNIRLANIVYDKSAFINRLFLQQEIYPDVKVKWVNKEGFLITVNTITIRHVLYTVADKADPDTPLFSGSCGFVIVRHDDRIWRILSWTDEPDGVSFFSPAPE